MTENKLGVLVLGVGGNIGQGILKALQRSSVSHRAIGACVSPQALGLYTTDQSYVSPFYNDPHFLEWLIDICNAEKVDVILTGVEPILYFLAENAEEIHQKTGAVCVTSPPQKLLMAQDKWLTCQWLEANRFNFPQYALSDDPARIQILLDTCGFPLLAKPRFGRGGTGIIKVTDRATLQFVTHKKDYILQEYLSDEQGEFTVGSFTNKTGELIGTIVMKRELLEGTTYRAEVGHFPEVEAEALRILRQLQPTGPCNLQLRAANGVPVCFEINMRFSGTTPIKAHFGFNEVQAALEHYILGKKIALPTVRKGIALRYWNELYINTEAHAKLCKTGALQSPKQYEFVLENYGTG